VKKSAGAARPAGRLLLKEKALKMGGKKKKEGATSVPKKDRRKEKGGEEWVWAKEPFHDSVKANERKKEKKTVLTTHP